MSLQENKNDPWALHLPFDVLSRIFLFCPYQTSTLSPKSTPWTLGQICSSWRSATLETGRLWSTINLTLTKLTGTPTQLEMLRTAISRANGSPLYITFECDRPISPNAIPALQILLQHAEHWETLLFQYYLDNLLIDNESAFDLARRLDDSSTHSKTNFRLSHIQFNWRRIGTPDTRRSQYYLRVAQSLTPYINQPNMRSLHMMELSLFFVEQSNGLPPFPWDQITRFVVCVFKANEILSVLPKCTNLESLEVRSATPWDLNTLSAHIIHLSNVHSFILQCPYLDMPDNRSILPFLNLPNLRHLGVCAIDDLADIDTLSQFILLHSHTIRSVDIDMTCDQPMDITIENLLRLLPNTTHLVLRGRLFKHLFHCMSTASSSSNILLPNLQNLEIHFDILSPPLTDIIDLVFHMPHLRNLYVQSYTKQIAVKERAYSRLKALRLLGVDGAVDFVESTRASNYDQFICEELLKILWREVNPRGWDNRHRENIPILEEVMNRLEEYNVSGVLQSLDFIQVVTLWKWEKVKNILEAFASMDQEMADGRLRFMDRAGELAKAL